LRAAAEGVIVAVIVDVLSFEATRQVDVLHEHVARIHALRGPVGQKRRG